MYVFCIMKKRGCGFSRKDQRTKRLKVFFSGDKQLIKGESYGQVI
jgi:hypothetical protein